MQFGELSGTNNIVKITCKYCIINYMWSKHELRKIIILSRFFLGDLAEKYPLIAAEFRRPKETIYFQRALSKGGLEAYCSIVFLSHRGISGASSKLWLLSTFLVKPPGNQRLKCTILRQSVKSRSQAWNTGP